MGEEEEEKEESRESDDSDEEEERETETEKWSDHSSSKQRILLVGEGDFSFSLCLAREFGCAHNTVATCLDTQEMIANKYSNAVDNVRELEERGCLVFYGVDAMQMSYHFFLRTHKFDRVIYNFPHVGFLFRENSYCQIQLCHVIVVLIYRLAPFLSVAHLYVA